MTKDRNVGPAGLAQSVVREGRTLHNVLEPLGTAETIPAFLSRNAARFAGKPALREKRNGRFEDATWDRLLLQVLTLGRFLRERGIARGDRVAVLSRNRSEMLAAELSVMSIGAIFVPLFHWYSREQASALIAHSGAKAILAADLSQLRKLEPNDLLTLIVAFEGIGERERGEAIGWFRGEFAPFPRVGENAGPASPAEIAQFLRDASDLDPRDPCLMMYTSGTAGDLKGVLLCHDNILSQQRALKKIWNLSDEDRFLSYLPWHHSFGGIFEKYNALWNGAPLALDDSWGKDMPLLLANWKAVRPTVYFSVPAVYLELYNHVRLHPEEEDEIFHPGLRFVFTAAAPLPAIVDDYFAGRGIPVIEGWGLTETSPCCSVTDLREPRNVPGMVGYPIPGVSIRLEDDGEILVRGPNVMLGYHRNEEETRRVLAADGWFRTGDLGSIDGNALRLIARKDRLFKLLTGERVTPSPLETRIAGMCRYIQHVVVGGSGREFVTALIFPHLELIRKVFGSDMERAEREVRESFIEAIRQVNEGHPVHYERVKAIVVLGHCLTLEDGELTPSMKVRPKIVLKNHEKQLEAVYEPSAECDCRLLRRVIRLVPDSRPCFLGKGTTLDRCHECGSIIAEDD
jgi:long-subunit acyl-CoA synthetase (AMP-forming)